MKHLIEVVEGRLPAVFFVIGDEAFNCTEKFLVPYSGRGLEVWKDSFNFHLSVMRQCIERAFAILTQRWGVLWREIKCSYYKWPLLLTVLAKLHNYCVDKSIPLNVARLYEDEERDDEPDVILNSQDPEEPVTAGYSTTRANFTRDLEDKGKRRPNYAAMNSRA